MLNNMPQAWTNLTENQLRQYVDGEALLRALTAARQEAGEVRGSMIWREMRGVRYLIRTSASGAQKTIGTDSTESRDIYERFMARKQAASERVKSLMARFNEQIKLNRVYRVGRTPRVVIDVLKALEKARIADQFLTVGTHALYAYESAAGVFVGSETMATRDLDLLFDTRKRLAFVAEMQRMDTSLLGVLRQADPSFRVMTDQLQTAVNDQGFEVDIIRRLATPDDPHPLRMTEHENDLWAVQVPTGARLVSAGRFEQMVVSATGQMATMRTVHPLDFVTIKTALSKDPKRDPLKARKDVLQAKVAQALWDEYLIHREK
jgi:Nucleotidyltransferase